MAHCIILYSPVGILRCPWRCGGSEEGSEEEEEVQGPAKLIAIVGGLWVGLQVSVEHMRYMCIHTHMVESLPGSLYGLADVVEL